LCVAEWQRDYSKRNSKRAVERVKRWREKNPAKLKAARRRYQQKHKYIFRAACKRWRRRNPEKVRAYKQLYARRLMGR